MTHIIARYPKGILPKHTPAAGCKIRQWTHNGYTYLIETSDPADRYLQYLKSTFGANNEN